MLLFLWMDLNYNVFIVIRGKMPDACHRFWICKLEYYFIKYLIWFIEHFKWCFCTFTKIFLLEILCKKQETVHSWPARFPDLSPTEHYMGHENCASFFRNTLIILFEACLKELKIYLIITIILLYFLCTDLSELRVNKSLFQTLFNWTCYIPLFS